MNPKLKKIIAIIGLVFMIIFSISFVVYLIKPEAYNGRLLHLTLISLGMGLLMFSFIYFTGGFPSQQNKEQEMKRLREEYLKKLEEKAIKNKDEESNEDETSPYEENSKEDNQEDKKE